MNSSMIAELLRAVAVNVTERANGTLDDEDLEIFEQFTEEQRKQLFGYRVFAYTIGSLIIISNVIVVVSSWLILKKGEKSKNTYILLGNVSLADAFIGANVLFGISVRHDAASEGLCVVQIGMIVSPTLVSIFTVALIAVDRYIYILHGLHYRRWVNTARVRLGILFTWLLGLTLGFLPATGWMGDTRGGHKCWYIIVAPPELIALISIAGVLPIFIVCILYSIILFHALRKVSQLQTAINPPKNVRTDTENEIRINRVKRQGENEAKNQIERGTQNVSDVSGSNNSLSIQTITSSVESGLSAVPGPLPELNAGKFQNMINKMRQSIKTDRKRRENEEPNKWRAIKVVLLTTGSFVFTWVPYFVATIMYITCDKETNEEWCLQIEVALASPLAVLGLVNSLLNPLIYAWWHRGFTTAVKKIICGFRKAFVSTVDSPITSSHG